MGFCLLVIGWHSGLLSAANAAPMSLLPPQAIATPAPSVANSDIGMPPKQDVVGAKVVDVVLSSPATPTAGAAVPKKQNKKKRYNVVVLGDSLGDGVWAGLYHALRKDKRFNVIRKSKVATGFVRKDYYDWSDVVREVTAETKVDIAVVIMGTNDRQPIVEKGSRYPLFSAKWREVYNARIDDFTETLQASGAQIYWVGLPVMRGSTFERDMKTFSEIFKSRAAANGVIYLPTHDLLTDDEGNYAAYGLDGNGRKRLLRAEDGIHFTMQGYEQLVQPIAAAIKRDVEGGLVVADASGAEKPIADMVNDGHRQIETSGAKSASAIGLKSPIYDAVEARPGRSDDWRWAGAQN